ncbi:MAG: DUF2183 domain-containing protein, partial [Ferruginibacter sp.]|nr:DUF2183 domain-containing protein [Ferruginibacter sp.]
LSLSPLQKKHYRTFFLYNTIALLRLFMVRPIKNATVKLVWNNVIYETTTAKDGFFKFEWENNNLLQPGVYSVKVMLIKRNHSNTIKAQSDGNIIVPSSTSYSFISDIDDTFLISHSSNLRKRLFVLLTENALSRKPFDGAVNHYRMLHGIDDEVVSDNAFFYVSSSEWNLYDYIKEFVQEYKLPEGVFLLNQIKTFSKLFSTGQNNHGGKFTRIVKIMEAFPQQKFVLLGDDSQKDIDIYTSIVEHFPQSVYCVYIRRVGTPEKENVLLKQKLIENKGVLFFYFAHSEEAILHSQKIGLIK